MLVAWISTFEIIPFDSVEYVEEVGDNITPLQIEVHMTSSRKSMLLTGVDSESFLKEYQAYLQIISDTLQNVGYEQ